MTTLTGAPVDTVLPARAEPVAANERIGTLDVLRGFALLGVLLVNMGLFSHTWLTLVTGRLRGETMLDLAAEFVILWLATSKFYVLFSFLFGLGFSIQMVRWQARGEGGTGRMIRRLLVLMGFGLLHALLIWSGDILFLYGGFGLVLLLFRKAQPRTLLIWAAGLVAVPFLLGLGLAALGVLGAAATPAGVAGGPDMPGSAAWFLALEQQAIETFARGTWGEIFVWRAVEWVVFVIVQGFGAGFQILAMFCLGLAAGKLDVFRRLADLLPHFRRAALIGLGLGLPANAAVAALFVWGRLNAADPLALPLSSVYSTLLLLTGPLLSAGYVGALVLALQSPLGQRLLSPLASMGRMALTNYLVQSLVSTFIFYSFGLGLFGSVGAAAGLGLSVLIWLVQLPVSVAWFRFFKFGPAEWLWRTLTYGRLTRSTK